MKAYTLFMVLLLYGYCCNAQGHKLKHAISAELLGNAGLYSLNYELSLGKVHAYSFGLGYEPENWSSAAESNRFFIFLPSSYSYKKSIGHHQILLTATVLTKWTVYKDLPDHFLFNPQLGVGYRWNKHRKIFYHVGVILQIPCYLSMDQFESFFFYSSPLKLWPEIAIGYKFN